MSTARRFLPSMSLLRAFEAAARHQSFTEAAAELNLTQGAISRQIRVLEEQLGSDLFLRERQTVRLTAAGETYAGEIREALRRISNATLNFRANPKGGTLNLAILPTFGTRWLAPRLPSFLRENPGITINLTTRLAPFDFNLEQADVAIHFGSADWPGAELELLMSENVVPACSRSLLEEYEFQKPSDLLKAPLLHLVSRPDAWIHKTASAARRKRLTHNPLPERHQRCGVGGRSTWAPPPCGPRNCHCAEGQRFAKHIALAARS